MFWHIIYAYGLELRVLLMYKARDQVREAPKADLIEVGLHLHILDPPLQEGHQGTRWDLVGAYVGSVHECLIAEDKAGVTEACTTSRRLLLQLGLS